MSNNKTMYLDCVCGTLNHIGKFTWFTWDTHPKNEIYFEVVLEQASFWHRLKTGLKYILFGEPHPVAEILLSRDKANELKDFLQKYSESE